MAVPAMLLAYGVSLRLGPRPGAGEPVTQIGVIVALKLVVQPLTAGLVGHYVIGLSGLDLFAVTVIAALPTAQNVFTVAVRYQRGEILARDAIFISTLLSVPALIIIAALLAEPKAARAALGSARKEVPVADIDDFDIDRSIAQAWAEFQARLSEVVSMIDDSADLTIGTGVASDAPAPYLRLSSPQPAAGARRGRQQRRPGDRTSSSTPDSWPPWSAWAGSRRTPTTRRRMRISGSS